jgi:hypothetical protein
MRAAPRSLWRRSSDSPGIFFVRYFNLTAMVAVTDYPLQFSNRTCEPFFLSK